MSSCFQLSFVKTHFSMTQNTCWPLADLTELSLACCSRLPYKTAKPSKLLGPNMRNAGSQSCAVPMNDLIVLQDSLTAGLYGYVIS